MAIPKQRLFTKTRVGSDSVGRSLRPSEGKVCALCPRKDTDEDLVDGGLMKWGLGSRAGKPTGKVCYYCRRVWRANYSASFSLEKFIPHCAQNKPIFDTFSSLVSFAIDKMVAAGSHDVTIRMSDFDATALCSVLSQ